MDLPYGIKPVLTGTKLLKERKADLVLGSRDLPESEISCLTAGAGIAKTFFEIVNSFPAGITDTPMQAERLPRQAADDIFPDHHRFAFDVEVLFLARRKVTGLN